MPNDNHMDAHIIYNLTVVVLFKCIFNLGPRAVNMLQAPRYLNPAEHYSPAWRLLSSLSTPLTCPTTVYRRYAYADDLEIMHADEDWQAVEEVLSKDLENRR